MNWFVSPGSRPQAPAQLFCLPYAGAGASAFRRWQEGIGADVEVLPVQLPGRENRISEDPRFTVAEVAAAIADRADRPYAIYGHSMGGRLGFEVVRELRRTGRTLPLRLYVGGARAPHVTAASLFDGLSGVDDAELLRRLGDGGGLPAELLAHPELVELLLPLLRADFGRVDSYRYVPGEPLPVPIVTFNGRHDRAVSREQSAGWGEHTAAGFTLHDIDGGHFFLADRLSELLGMIRADLATALRAVAAPADVATDAHRVPLGDTGWSVWRDAVLRTTGFPADGLTWFAAPWAAAAADELITTGAGADRFDTEFAQATAAAARRFAELAADPLLREAVTWQNRGALVLLDALVAGGPQPRRNNKHRDRERTLLKYWQRYCGKNETVGFFGPGCWVTVDPTRPEVADVRPGPGLTRRRWVPFESWALAAYADRLGTDLAVRRWWPPLLAPQLSLRDRTVLRPGRPPVTLTPVEAALLAAADGRPAVELVTDPAVGLRRPEDGYALLDRLVERELITWDAALPVSPEAERVLTGRIDAIGDEAVRAAARAGLDRLVVARDAVAAAAGDPGRLHAALDALDETFTELTGQAAQRREGQMYAGRTLCYEDTGRDLDVTFGRPLLDALAAPLDVLLRAARWLVGALEEAYTAVFRELYDELRAEAGDGPVRLADLWFLAQGMFWGEGERPVDRVAAEFAARWAGLFGLADLPTGATEVRLAVADLADRVDAVFPAPAPSDWPLARLHSPDLQICAAGAEALARGEFTVVLGELHAAWASFDTAPLVAGHPDGARLRAALAADVGARLRLLYPTDWPRHTSRVAAALTAPADRQLAFRPAPGVDPARVLPTVDLTVDESDGRLVATGPDGRRWSLTEVFAELLSAHAVDGFKLVAAAPYTPRITLDRLVVARRTWRTTAGASGLGPVTGERDRFLAVRRWRARLDLPEQVYVKLGSETKPCFVDLSSPAYANMLCAMVRSAGMTHGDGVPLVVGEMLPGPDDAWVPDAAGRRYLSELRLHVVDADAAGPRR
ncbi:thioesterase domain-containing protein [Micromonospora halophytica]|uniref:Surfactin synthase thioesterase subunit n=1 Tax=Micromonospora halophytica TaxID=47864 RepID=A0A1C5HUT2_9ACTN|nr:thioesterase domain-containing protein [Micromonospora halophytica]SCG49770.1 Surfactin synthase thioesterase subunit [Micromonospora halophytica]